MSAVPSISMTPAVTIFCPWKNKELSWVTKTYVFAGESVRVNIPSPASIVREPPSASTVMGPPKDMLPWQDSVALTGDELGSPPVTVRLPPVKLTDAAAKVTEPPSGLPSAICTSSMFPFEMGGEFEVPGERTALSPLGGSSLGFQFAAFDQLPSTAPVQV